MIKNKLLTEDEFKAMDKEIRAEVAEVGEFAKNSAEPSEDELYTDIYRGELSGNI